MTEDFSDISDGEVVCATQFFEELYGDDGTDDSVHFLCLLARACHWRVCQLFALFYCKTKILLLFSFCASDTFAGISFCALLCTNLLGTISIILMQAGPKFDGI